jgi:hypothetical protein
MGQQGAYNQGMGYMQPQVIDKKTIGSCYLLCVCVYKHNV